MEIKRYVASVYTKSMGLSRIILEARPHGNIVKWGDHLQALAEKDTEIADLKKEVAGLKAWKEAAIKAIRDDCECIIPGEDCPDTNYTCHDCIDKYIAAKAQGRVR